MKTLIAAALALVSLSGCTAVGLPCVGATYESSDCHANGTPVTAAEKVKVAHQRIETCRHLYQMMGDHSLSPMQMEAVRVEWNTRWCSSSGFVPGRN